MKSATLEKRQTYGHWVLSSVIACAAPSLACGSTSTDTLPDAAAIDASSPDASFDAGVDAAVGAWPGWASISTIAIVGLDDATDMLLHSTATDLQSHLDLVTGRAFAIVEGDVIGAAIRLDVDATAPQFAAANDQAYRIIVDERGVRVVGATTIAAMHGAYDVMRRAGFRWFFPNAAWEVRPPALEELTRGDQVIAPRFEYRGLGQGNSDEIHLWQRRNRFAVPRVYTVRQLWDYIPNVAQTTWRDLLTSQSPAACSVQNGNKTQVFPNTDDPGMWSMSEQFCKKQLDKASVKDGTTQVQATCDYSPSDGLRTYCDSWFPKDSGGNVLFDSQVATDHIYNAFNNVGNWVGANYQGKFAGVLSYANFANVPSTEVDPHVYVSLCPYGLFSGEGPRLSFAERIAGFAENKGKRNLRLGVYEFVDDWAYTHDRWNPGLLSGVTRRIRSVADQNNSVGNPAVKDFFSEASKNWVPRGHIYYAYANLTFDSHADPAALMDDFFVRAFGPATATMRGFYARLDAEPTTDRVWGLSFRDLQTALQQAGADDAVAERVRHVFYWTYYMWKWGRVIKYGIDNGLISQSDLQNKVLPYLSRIESLGVLNAAPSMSAIESNLLNLTGAQVKALKLPTTPFSPIEAKALLDEALAAFANVALIDPPLIDPASAPLVAAGKNASDSQAGWSGSDLAEIVVPAAANEAITVTVVVPTVAAGYLKWYDPQGTLLGGQQVTHKTCTKPCVFVFNSAAAGLYRLEVATATVVVTLNRPAGVDVRTSDFTRGGSYYFAVQHPSPLVVAWSGDAPGGAVTVTDPNGVPSTLLTETDVSFAAPAVGLWKVTIPPGSASNRSLSIFGSAPLVWYNGANVLTTP